MTKRIFSFIILLTLLSVFGYFSGDLFAAQNIDAGINSYSASLTGMSASVRGDRPLTWSVDWGDGDVTSDTLTTGSPNGTSINASHTFTSSGDFFVMLCVENAPEVDVVGECQTQLVVKESDPSPTPAEPGPDKWVELNITTIPSGMNWVLSCPSSPYSCNGMTGTGSQYITNCQNGACEGTGTYTISDGGNSGQSCSGNSQYRGLTVGVRVLDLTLDCGGGNPGPTPTTPPGGNTAPVTSSFRITTPNYCVSGPGGVFSWGFVDADPGDTQASFQIQIDDSSNFSNVDYDTGKVMSSATSHIIPAATLSFGKVYYARMKVWDSQDTSSTFWQPLVYVNDVVSGAWTTPPHRYPSNLGFSFSPAKPTVNQIVQFDGTSTASRNICYNGGNNPTNCANWNWSFGDGQSSSPNSTTNHAYTSKNNYTVTMTLTDSEGQVCATTQVVPIVNPPPKWKEVAPQ